MWPRRKSLRPSVSTSLRKRGVEALPKMRSNGPGLLPRFEAPMRKLAGQAHSPKKFFEGPTSGRVVAGRSLSGALRLVTAARKLLTGSAWTAARAGRFRKNLLAFGDGPELQSTSSSIWLSAPRQGYSVHFQKGSLEHDDGPPAQ